MTLNILLSGRVPSKKNSRICFVKYGKMMNIPSKAYKEWHKDASEHLLSTGSPLVENIESVTLSFWAPDKRATDLSNKAESIMDLLVDNGILLDDNWNVVPNLNLKFMGVDRSNPRCHIEILEKSNG